MSVPAVPNGRELVEPVQRLTWDPAPPGAEPPHAGIPNRPRLPDPVTEPWDAVRVTDQGLDSWKPIESLVRMLSRPGDRVLAMPATPSARADLAVVELSDPVQVPERLEATLRAAPLVIAWWRRGRVDPQAVLALASRFQPRSAVSGDIQALILRGAIPPTMRPDPDGPDSWIWNPKPTPPDEPQDVVQEQNLYNFDLDFPETPPPRTKQVPLGIPPESPIIADSPDSTLDLPIFDTFGRLPRDRFEEDLGDRGAPGGKPDPGPSNERPREQYDPWQSDLPEGFEPGKVSP